MNPLRGEGYHQEETKVNLGPSGQHLDVKQNKFQHRMDKNIHSHSFLKIISHFKSVTASHKMYEAFS